MPRKTSKTRRPRDEDDLTPKQRQELDAQLAIGDAQAKAGLSYGPFDHVEGLLKSLLKARKRTRRITIEVPAILLDHLEKEAKRFDMTLKELMVTILETHRFADSGQQLITRAIAQSTKDFKTGRYEGRS